MTGFHNCIIYTDAKKERAKTRVLSLFLYLPENGSIVAPFSYQLASRDTRHYACTVNVKTTPWLPKFKKVLLTLLRASPLPSLPCCRHGCRPSVPGRKLGQRCMQDGPLFRNHTSYFKYELRAGPLRRPRRLPSSSLRSSVSETTGSES